MKYTASVYRCPRCAVNIWVKNVAERDITMIWCPSQNCAFYFTPLGRILTEKESQEIPRSYRLGDVFN